MVVTIKRDSGLFDKSVADELNKSFATINEKIENYQNSDLDYKEDIQLIKGNDNSFRSGNLLCIRESFTISKRLEKFTALKSLSVNIPYDVWGWATTEKQEMVYIHILNNTIYGYGTFTQYPQKAYLVLDIVVPKA